ncbi:hypothetical protein AVL50_30640 [Flammeovirga sp. SJP92]|nr:hypothetical protein AVL50_30640 [Flammeovirga sp. SJP92]
MDSGISPSFVTGSFKVGLLFALPFLISLTFSVLGYMKRNKFRKWSMLLNVLTLIYLLIPFGFYLSMGVIID